MRLRLALLALPLAVLTACGGPAIPPAQNYGTIAGRVYDRATNAPVAGALVTVDTILTATSGSDGSYRIGTIPLGTYQMGVQASGYAAPSLSSPPYSGSIGAGQTITVDIPLTKQ
jgi:hypothetical protein